MISYDIFFLWLTSLSVICSRSIHFAVNRVNFFFFLKMIWLGNSKTQGSWTISPREFCPLVHELPAISEISLVTPAPAGPHSNVPLIPEGWHKVLTCTFKTKQINFHGSSWILLNVGTLGVGLPGFEFYHPLSLNKQVTYLDFFLFSIWKMGQ